MRGRANPVGLVGRAIAAAGAAIWIVSLFLDVFDGSESRWDFYDRIDVVTLVLAIAGIGLLVLSLFVLEDLLLLLAGVIGGYLAGSGIPDLVEVSDADVAIGGWLGAIGPVVMVGGVALALLVKPGQDLAWMPATAATPAPAPSPAPPPEPAAPAAQPAAPPPQPAEPAGPPAGWYADPTGQQRLRYWDGRQWTEQTQT